MTQAYPEGSTFFPCVFGAKCNCLPFFLYLNYKIIIIIKDLPTRRTPFICSTYFTPHLFMSWVTLGSLFESNDHFKSVSYNDRNFPVAPHSNLKWPLIGSGFYTKVSFSTTLVCIFIIKSNIRYLFMKRREIHWSGFNLLLICRTVEAHNQSIQKWIVL